MEDPKKVPIKKSKIKERKKDEKIDSTMARLPKNLDDLSFDNSEYK